MLSVDAGAQEASYFYSHVDPLWSLLMLVQVLYLGRAPRTKETLHDFRERCRVTRHSRAFRGLTGCQRTPGFCGVTHSSTLMMNDHIHAHTPNMLMSLCICNANVIANSHVTCMMHTTWNILINRTSCQVPFNIYRKHITSIHFMPIFIDIVVSCILAFINND